MYCTKCGKEIRNTQRFCTGCGTPVNPTKKAKPHRRKNKRLFHRTVGLLTAIVMCVGAAGGYFLMSDGTVIVGSAETNGNMDYCLGEGCVNRRVKDEESAVKAANDVLGYDNFEISDVRSSGNTVYYRMNETYEGIPVSGRQALVTADKDSGEVVGFYSNSREIRDLDINPAISAETAEEKIREYISTETPELVAVTREPSLIISVAEETQTLCYRTEVCLEGINFYAFVNANDGSVMKFDTLEQFSDDYDTAVREAKDAVEQRYGENDLQEIPQPYIIFNDRDDIEHTMRGIRLKGGNDEYVALVKKDWEGRQIGEEEIIDVFKSEKNHSVTVNDGETYTIEWARNQQNEVMPIDIKRGIAVFKQPIFTEDIYKTYLSGKLINGKRFEIGKWVEDTIWGTGCVYGGLLTGNEHDIVGSEGYVPALIENIAKAYDYYAKFDCVSPSGDKQCPIYAYSQFKRPTSSEQVLIYNPGLRDAIINLKNTDFNNAASVSIIEGKMTRIIASEKDRSSKPAETKLNIIGHEYTHAVTAFVDGYDDRTFERKTVDEALGDIMGQMMLDKPEWKILSRNMKDPKALNNRPAHMNDYKEEQSGVDEHYNATIIDHAAYLMYTGLDGEYEKITREDDNDFGNLWYKTILKLLTTTDFRQLRALAERSASEMCREGRMTDGQMECVKAAFDAVGIEPYSYRITQNCKMKLYDCHDKIYLNSTLHIYDSNDKKCKIVKINETAKKEGEFSLNLEKGFYRFVFVPDDCIVINRAAMNDEDKAKQLADSKYCGFTVEVVEDPTKLREQDVLKNLDIKTNFDTPVRIEEIFEYNDIIYTYWWKQTESEKVHTFPWLSPGQLFAVAGCVYNDQLYTCTRDHLGGAAMTIYQSSLDGSTTTEILHICDSDLFIDHDEIYYDNGDYLCAYNINTHEVRTVWEDSSFGFLGLEYIDHDVVVYYYSVGDSGVTYRKGISIPHWGNASENDILQEVEAEQLDGQKSYAGNGKRCVVEGDDYYLYSTLKVTEYGFSEKTSEYQAPMAGCCYIESISEDFVYISIHTTEIDGSKYNTYYYRLNLSDKKFEFLGKTFIS